MLGAAFACVNFLFLNLYFNNITTFLGDATITGVSNPQVLYDAGSDRFIFFCEVINSGGIFASNKIVLAFSKTNNPTAGFWRYEIVGDPTGTGDGFDEPKIAVNDSEVFYTGNLYTIGTPNVFHQAILFQFSKLEGYAGGTIPAGGYYTGIPGSPFSLLPVSYGQAGNYDPGIFLVNTSNAGGTSVSLFQVSANLCCSPVLNQWILSGGTYAPPANAMQSGTSCLLQTGDCRALSGFFLNNTVHFVFNCDNGSGYSGINYNRLSVTSLSNVSSVFSMAGFDCAYPSVVSFATTTTDASVMIGFGRSGSTIFPEMQVVNCDNAMSWSAPTLVRAGDGYASFTSATLEPWGTYTGTSRYHASLTPSIWMNGMYGNTSNKWDTWIAEIQDSPVPACDTAAGLTATSITLTSAVLIWSPVTGATSYNIRYRPVGSGTWTTTTSTVATKTISGLISGTTYEFQVETVCTVSSNSGFGSSKDFTTLVNHTAVNSVTDPSATRVFPNPITNTFSVEFQLTENMNLDIAVVDMTGRQVKGLYKGTGTIGDNVFSFDKTNLSSGIYFLVIKANSATIKNEKIVVE